MLVKMLSAAEKIVLVICIASIIFLIADYLKTRKKASPQSILKQRILSNKFAVANAVFISRLSEVTNEVKRDYLHDSIGYAYSSDRLLPDIDFGSHRKGYQYISREQAPRSVYRIEVDGNAFDFTSRHETAKTLPVYYNAENPQEIFTVGQVEEALSWNERKERTYHEIEKDETRDVVIFFWCDFNCNHCTSCVSLFELLITGNYNYRIIQELSKGDIDYYVEYSGSAWSCSADCRPGSSTISCPNCCRCNHHKSCESVFSL